MGQIDTGNAEAAAQLEQVFNAMLGASGQGSTSGLVNTSLNGNTNAAKAFNFLTNNGFTTIAAAGICGNWYYESGGIDPTKVQGGTNSDTYNGDQGYGIAQFTPSTKLISWCQGKGLDYTKLSSQLQYALYSLSTSLIAQLNAAATPAQAAQLYLTQYERPKDPAASLSQRQQYANQIYQQYATGTNTGSVGNNPSTSNSKKSQKYIQSGKLDEYANNIGSGNQNSLGQQITTVYDVIVQAANAMASSRLPYIYGGGHGNLAVTPNGYDCSSSVSYVLYAAGLIKANQAFDTGTEGRVLKALGGIPNQAGSEPGSITIWVDMAPSNVDNHGPHTFMLIGGTSGRYWGTTDGTKSSPGAGAWLSSGNSTPADVNDGNFVPYYFSANKLKGLATYNGPLPSGSTTIPSSGYTEDGTSNAANTISQASAEAFTQQLDFPTIEDSVVAILLGSEGKGLLHDQQLFPFVQQVTHTFDYESGFTTTAQLSSPSLMSGYTSQETGLPQNMVAAMAEPINGSQGNANARLLDPSFSGLTGTPEYKIFSSVAQELAANQVDMTGLSNALNISSKVGSSLDQFISNFGMQRQNSVAGQGYVVFQRPTPAPANITVPQGTVIQANGVNANSPTTVQYATSAAGTIAQGETASGPVAVQAITTGSATNIPAGALNQFVGTIPAGVSSVTNPVAINNGLDPEDDDIFKSRFQNTWARNLSGTTSSYLAVALAGAFSTKAVAIGQQSTFIEYIQIPDTDDAGNVNGSIPSGLAINPATTSIPNGTGLWTTALSDIPYAKNIFTNVPTFISDNGSGSYYYQQNIDYTFNVPPLLQGDALREIVTTAPEGEGVALMTGTNIKVESIIGFAETGTPLPTLVIVGADGNWYQATYTGYQIDSATGWPEFTATGQYTTLFDVTTGQYVTNSSTVNPDDTLVTVQALTPGQNVRWSNDLPTPPNQIRVIETDISGNPLAGASVDRYAPYTSTQYGSFTIEITGVSGNTLTVVRGFNGTTPATASSGLAVQVSAPPYIFGATVTSLYTSSDPNNPYTQYLVTYSAPTTIFTNQPVLPTVVNNLTQGSYLYNEDIFLLDDELPTLPTGQVYGDTLPGLIARTRAENTFYRPGIG
ncbi:unnamed protein product [Sphagnum balticum]